MVPEHRFAHHAVLHTYKHVEPLRLTLLRQTQINFHAFGCRISKFLLNFNQIQENAHKRHPWRAGLATDTPA
jgi:hypothetical protein